jgi:hypothetical protein
MPNLLNFWSERIGKDAMGVLAVGIDDTATETHKSEGWAFIVVPQKSVPELHRAAARLSKTPFHASKARKRNIGKYEKFLTIIRDVVSNNAPSLLAHIFDDPSWHTGLKQIAGTAVGTGQTPIGPDVEAALNLVTPPLLTLQRITADPGMTTDLVEVWLDESGPTRSFSSMKVDTQPVPISAAAFTKAFYNGYRKSKFPSAPEMAPDGFHVVPDDQSILIQAADVFGNFAAAYAAWKLGAANIRQVKGEAFGRVFNSPDIRQIAPCLSLEGNHLEISLRSQGALKLVIF